MSKEFMTGCTVGLWIAAATLMVASVARADLEIEITSGVEDPVVVAIVPFGWSGRAPGPFDIARVVDADLKRSGRFAPMERRDMVERPTVGDQVDFPDWNTLGAEVVVVGTVGPESAQNLRIRFEVFDVPRRKQLLDYDLSSPPDKLRATAHIISDLIYEALTGEPGIFSTRIAYVSVEGRGANRRYSLVVADADGENQQDVVQASGPMMSPAWSPDGRKIAYVLFENGRSVIYVQDLASGARSKVSARRGVNGAPAWSPDSQTLALTLSDVGGNLDIHLLDIRSGELRRVTRHSSIDTEPSFAPNGRVIYFNSDRSGGPQIYRLATDGGRPERVTFEGKYNARPRVSPDGEKIAVVHDDRGSYRIAIVDVASGALQVLSDGRLDESPSFAPSGSTIIYATQQGNRGVLATISVDGRVAQSLGSRGRDVREPIWSPFASGAGRN